MTDTEKYLTTEDLAARLQIPERTLEDWRRTGTGPTYVRLGKHVRYSPAGVERWLRDQAAKVTERGAE